MPASTPPAQLACTTETQSQARARHPQFPPDPAALSEIISGHRRALAEAAAVLSEHRRTIAGAMQAITEIRILGERLDR